MYLLKCLKSQGLPAKQLLIIFCAIIVSRILYALPAWGGYLSASLVSRIDAFLQRSFVLRNLFLSAYWFIVLCLLCFIVLLTHCSFFL